MNQTVDVIESADVVNCLKDVNNFLIANMNNFKSRNLKVVVEVVTEKVVSMVFIFSRSIILLLKS